MKNIKILSGSFIEGCGIMVHECSTDGYYHVIVRREKKRPYRLFIEVGSPFEPRRYYGKDIININSTIKEFLRGTPHKYIIEITKGTNENIVFRGTYGRLRRRKKLLNEYVQSWDGLSYADGTEEIGIMI